MYEEDIDYLSETIALLIWDGEAEEREDPGGKEYYHVDLSKYPVEKLPTDKEELKELFYRYLGLDYWFLNRPNS